MIHKEGHLFLAVLAIILIALNAIIGLLAMNQVIDGLILIASIIVFLFFLQFFRNPKRATQKNAKHIIAPADGKIVVIERTLESEYLKDERIQVSIFMSPINVHVNRNPVDGLVSFFKYHPGKYLVAWHPKSSTENERTSIVFKMADGLEIMVRQIAGAAARRIKWYVDKDSRVSQGGEFGFIKFGSRVDLFLPLDADIKVSIDEVTRGGETVLAVLK